MEDYLKFLETKQKKHIESGFEIDETELNKNMFPFQKFIVKRALKAGKYAIFADCGLGKTLMQLEWANQVSIQTSKPVLILAPLAIVEQTIREGNKFGIKLNKYDTDLFHEALEPSIFICNYDQLKNINCSLFSGIVLDESSILKGRDGKMSSLILVTCKISKV